MSDNRTHLEEKYTWDLTTIFATDADWETEYESTVYEPYASLGENLCLCVNEK